MDVLKLSVIIPSLNEEDHIIETLKSVKGQEGVREVIVVDGGSSDRTVSFARANGARVIKAARGRGPQLNAGWRESKGDWCLFLHADTQLPPGFGRLITASVRQQPPQGGPQGRRQRHQQQQQQQQWVRAAQLRPQPCWGCFRSISLTEVPGWQARLIEAGVALRTQLLRLPYGDQALFVERRALEAVQGFPDLRILEDVGMVRRLNALSPPAVVPLAVATSGRRYQRLGFWHTLAANQAVILGWAGGLPHELLARVYSALLERGRG